jgi:hypothetical protein
MDAAIAGMTVGVQHRPIRETAIPSRWGPIIFFRGSEISYPLDGHGSINPPRGEQTY